MIIQIYVLYWYHKYPIHPGMDRTKAMIFQHLYWTGVVKSVQKEVKNRDTFQRTKRSNINMVTYQLMKLQKYNGRQIYVDIIGPCVIKNKGKGRNFKFKGRYHYRFCNKMVWNNAIWWKTSYINCGLNWNYVIN